MVVVPYISSFGIVHIYFTSYYFINFYKCSKCTYNCVYFLIIGCSLFVFGISLLIAWLRIFKIFTNLFFLGFLLYRNMLISSIMDVYLSVSLCNSLRFLCFESTVTIYMFVIIIFLGSFLFFHYRRDRQTSLFLLVSYPFIEVKAFKGLNFIWNLRSISEPSALRKSA